MYKVSVLIPVFNAAPYIGQCLQSAFSQTLDSIEYIIIDDASTDDSMARVREIMTDFPCRAADVRIIRHETNMGPCAARKTGIEAASGEYIIHLDSDDWVESTCYESMYMKAVCTGADVVCCSYCEEHGDGQHAGLFGAAIPEDYDKRLRAVIALKASPFIWSKLVRRSLFSDPRFKHPSHDMAEDWALCVQYAIIAKRWDYIEEPFYHYRVSRSSASHNVKSKDNAVRIMEMERRNVEDVTGQLEDFSLAERYTMEIEARKSNVKRFMLPFLSDTEARKIWKSTFQEINLTMIANRLIPLEYRIKHACAMLGIYTSLYAAFNSLRRMI